MQLMGGYRAHSLFKSLSVNLWYKMRPVGISTNLSSINAEALHLIKSRQCCISPHRRALDLDACLHSSGLAIALGCTSVLPIRYSDEFSFAELHFVSVFAYFFGENDEVLIHSFESKKSLDKKYEPLRLDYQ